MKKVIITVIIVLIFLTSNSYGLSFDIDVYSKNNFNSVTTWNTSTNKLTYLNYVSDITQETTTGQKIWFPSNHSYQLWTFVGFDQSVGDIVYNSNFMISSNYNDFSLPTYPQLQLGIKFNNYFDPYISIEDLSSYVLPLGYSITSPGLGLVLPVKNKNSKLILLVEKQSVTGIRSYYINEYGLVYKYKYKRFRGILSYQNSNYSNLATDPIFNIVNPFSKSIYKSLSLGYELSNTVQISTGIANSNQLNSNIKYINLQTNFKHSNISVQYTMSSNDNNIFLTINLLF